MKNIVIVYFSGSGHTKLIAEAVQQGAAAVAGISVTLLPIEGSQIVDGRYRAGFQQSTRNLSTRHISVSDDQSAVTSRDIGQRRLANQHIASAAFDTLADEVKWLVAVQAQDLCEREMVARTALAGRG
jgi:hypothetical protein